VVLITNIEFVVGVNGWQGITENPLFIVSSENILDEIKTANIFASMNSMKQKNSKKRLKTGG